MYVVVADDLPVSALDLLKAEGWEIDARPGRSATDLKSALERADALVVRSATKVTHELIAAAPRLRAIARAGTGVDNVDVDAATARGIVVMNAPGANSISVAELAVALLLALARQIPAADASMKSGRWDKKAFLGEEVRGKVLGLLGLGRIGQEVARRAMAFDMVVVAHDPFITAEVAGALGVELASLDQVCARADYLSLHLPSNRETHHLFNAQRLAACKRGVRIINTARGDLIDEQALAAAIQAGHVAGAGLDVYQREPTTDHTLQQLRQVVATPHIAASTHEGQELVGVETASALRDFLKTGVIRNAVNLPNVSVDEYHRLQPFIALGRQLGLLLGQMGEARIEGIVVESFGELTATRTPMLADGVLVGLFGAILSDPVTAVNARAVAAARGISVTESQVSRPRPFTNLLSVKLLTSSGERWVEGTVIDRSPRLVTVDGVAVEAPLGGTLLLLHNDDQPGVIGDVGTILGRRGINIANFALGRGAHGAVGVVNVDETQGGESVDEQVLQEIRGVKAVQDARVVRT